MSYPTITEVHLKPHTRIGYFGEIKDYAKSLPEFMADESIDRETRLKVFAELPGIPLYHARFCKRVIERLGTYRNIHGPLHDLQTTFEGLTISEVAQKLVRLGGAVVVGSLPISSFMGLTDLEMNTEAYRIVNHERGLQIEDALFILNQ